MHPAQAAIRLSWLTLALGAALLATPAGADAAPGRLVFSLAANVPVSNVDAGGAGPSLMLPDGGVLVAADERATRIGQPAGMTLVQLRPDGSRDRAFGTGGVARSAVPGTVFNPGQLLRRPDGRLVVVGTGMAAAQFEGPRAIVVGLTAEGALDPSFGNGGIAALDVQGGCGGGCTAAALAPDGSIVVTGTTGQIPIATSPTDLPPTQWLVQRLTPSGALDTSFGTVTIPGAAGSGYATVVRPSGQIVVLGSVARITQLAGLTAAGAPDPTFNAGQPVVLPEDSSLAMLLRADGAIDVLGAAWLSRFTTAGELDTSFATGGAVALAGLGTCNNLPAMLPTADGGTIVSCTPAVAATPPGQPRLRVARITPDGEFGAVVGLEPAFGGGVASGRERTTGLLAQNSFFGTLLARPNGSYLAVGSVNVVRYTGEGEGLSAGFVAMAALTALLAPDLTFGDPPRAAVARVRLPRQRARSAVRLGRVLASVTASAPGLITLRVRDGRRRILAASVSPVYTPGTANIRVPLTATGRRVLRRARGMRVRVGSDFRDLHTERDRAAITARLR